MNKINSSRRQNISLSEASLKILKRIFLLFPLLGSAISKHLSFIPSDNTNSPLYETTKKLQEIYIDIASNLASKQPTEATHFLQFIGNLNKEDVRLMLKKLFRTLIDTQSKASPDSPLSKQQIYSAILSSDNGASILEFYTSLEDQTYLEWKQNLETTKQLPASLVYNSTGKTEDSKFWNNFFNFINANQLHFIEFIVSTCISLAVERKFEEISQFLVPFEQLKPLVFLFIWDRHKEHIISNKKFLQTFWTYNQVILVQFFSYLLGARFLR